MSTTEAVKSVSITNLVRRREAALEKLGAGLELLYQAYRSAGSEFSFPSFEITQHLDIGGLRLFKFGSRDEAVERARQEIDSSGWDYLMRESGLMSLMDATARKEWEAKIYKGDVPELTHENIEATFSALHEARHEMFERGVLAVYKSLSWDYKTNNPVKFGQKLILTYLTRFDPKFGFDFHRSTCNELDDLTRVCHILDGEPEPDHRNGFYNRLYLSRNDSPGYVEDEYIRVKYHKCGTGHVLLKNEAVVMKMNAILAKHYPDALPAR